MGARAQATLAITDATHARVQNQDCNPYWMLTPACLVTLQMYRGTLVEGGSFQSRQRVSFADTKLDSLAQPRTP